MNFSVPPFLSDGLAILLRAALNPGASPSPFPSLPPPPQAAVDSSAATATADATILRLVVLRVVTIESSVLVTARTAAPGPVSGPGRPWGWGVNGSPWGRAHRVRR